VSGGEVIARATGKSVEDLKKLLGPRTQRARVVYEACRQGWAVHDLLAGWGHEVIMADSTRVRQMGIGAHGRKNDDIDAETLARACEENRVPRAHVLSPHRRELRIEIGVRRALVEGRSNMIVTARGILRALGVKVPSCEAENFVKTVEKTEMSAEQRARVTPLLEMIRAYDVQLPQVDEKLVKLAAQEPVIQQLATVPGVGLIVAGSFVSVIDEAGRFGSAHKVESYLGLVPKESTSGGKGKQRLGAITKQGNSYLRSLLVQAAWCIMRLRDPHDPLKLWADAVAGRRGRKVAAVALARRLCGILWAIWRDGTVYDPTGHARESATGLVRQAAATGVQAAAMRKAAAKLSNRVTKSTAT